MLIWAWIQTTQIIIKIIIHIHEATNKSDLINQGGMSLADGMTLCHNENVVETEHFIVKTLHNSSVDTARNPEPPCEELDSKTQQTNKISEVNCSIKCVHLDTLSTEFEETRDGIVLNDHDSNIKCSSICSNSRGLQSDCLNLYHNKPHEMPLNARCSIKSQSHFLHWNTLPLAVTRILSFSEDSGLPTSAGSTLITND